MGRPGSLAIAARVRARWGWRSVSVFVRAAVRCKTRSEGGLPTQFSCGGGVLCNGAAESRRHHSVTGRLYSALRVAPHRCLHVPLPAAPAHRGAQDASCLWRGDHEQTRPSRQTLCIWGQKSQNSSVVPSAPTGDCRKAPPTRAGATGRSSVVLSARVLGQLRHDAHDRAQLPRCALLSAAAAWRARVGR